MTLQQIHYFVVTANLRSFTKAAEACHVSQPALSHAIKELESELGCRLFFRIGRSIRLTELGEKCLTKAREAEKAVDELMEIATQAEPTHEITIGYTVLGHLNAYFAFQSKVVPKGFLQKHQIFTVYDEITEIKQHLVENKYDLIVIPAINCNNLPLCERVQISPDKLNLIVCKKNELWNRRIVKIDELANQRFVFYPNNEDLNQAYLHLCMQHGFTPQIAGYGKKMGDIVSEVLQKNAVAFCSATFNYLENDDIRILELAGSPSPFHLELIRLKSNANPAASELFRFLQKGCGSCP